MVRGFRFWGHGLGPRGFRGLEPLIRSLFLAETYGCLIAFGAFCLLSVPGHGAGMVCCVVTLNLGARRASDIVLCGILQFTVP